MGLVLIYLNLTQLHCKGQGKGHTHLDGEYPGNREIYGKKYNLRQTASHVWAFDWHIYDLTLTLFQSSSTF